MLTVKSDDIIGRSATFDAIVKGIPIEISNSPAAFNVLVNNLRGLCLDIGLVKNANGQRDDRDGPPKRLGRRRLENKNYSNE